MSDGSFTSTDLLAACSQVLEKGGYTYLQGISWDDSRARVFEDHCGFVAIVVYDTWSELSSHWLRDQTTFAELITSHVRRSEPKAWEGYLVLLTPGIAELEAEDEMTRIRYDVSLVRKIVATADDIKQISDVRHALLPLLPLDEFDAEDKSRASLGLLPELLAKRGIAVDVTRALVTAFREDQDLLKCLHRHRGEE